MKLSNSMRLTLALAIIASFVVVPEINAQIQAQQLGPQAVAEAKAASKRRLQKLRAGRSPAHSADDLQFLLEHRIHEIKAVAGLTDKQVSQLNLTAKVVARKLFDGQGQRLLLPTDKRQTPADGDESFSDQDAESKTGDDPKKMFHEIKRPVPLETALKHKTWTNAIHSILSAEEQTTLQTHDDNRSQQLREVAVRYRTWELVKRLRLRDDQVQPVSEVVDRIEGDELVQKMDKNLGAAVIIMAGITKAKKVTPRHLQDILSESQMEAFKSKDKGKYGGLNLQFGVNKGAGKSLKARGVRLDSKAARLTVRRVTPNSPMEQMGVVAGDIIDEVNGDPVDTLVQINRALQADGKFTLTVLRDGETIQLESKE